MSSMSLANESDIKQLIWFFLIIQMMNELIVTSV